MDAALIDNSVAMPLRPYVPQMESFPSQCMSQRMRGNIIVTVFTDVYLMVLISEHYILLTVIYAVSSFVMHVPLVTFNF